MDAEYKFQHSNGDRFWGIDKERHRMLQDLGNMTREDSLSHDQEKYYKAMEVRQKWDQEHHNILKEKAMVNALEENDRRAQYMRAFFQSTSSALL